MLLGGVKYLRPVSGKIFEVPDVTACLLSRVNIGTEENVKKFGGTVGRGLGGSTLLDPAGRLDGLLIGRRQKKIVFTVEFHTGEKMLASSDASVFTAIETAAFGAPAAYAAALTSRE
jgi:hypothetical protein